MANPKKKPSTKGFALSEKTTRLNKPLSMQKLSTKINKPAFNAYQPMQKLLTKTFPKNMSPTTKKLLKKVPYVGAALITYDIGKSVSKIIKNKRAMTSYPGSKNYKKKK